MDAGGILNNFKNIAVTDCLASFWVYDFVHAVCGVHILRELLTSAQCGYEWAVKMSALLVCLVKKVNDNGGVLRPRMQNNARNKYKEIITQAYAETMPREKTSKLNKHGKTTVGRPPKSPTMNLLIRLDERKDDMLRFTTDKEVPFTNNRAERAIRWVKLHQKISGCFRCMETGQGHCHLMSYIMTCRQHGISDYDAVEMLVKGETPLFIREWLDMLAEDKTISEAA
jgi:transposase